MIKKTLNRKYLNKKEEVQPRTIEEVKKKTKKIEVTKFEKELISLAIKQSRFNDIIKNINEDLIKDKSLVYELQDQLENLKEVIFKLPWYKRWWKNIKKVLFYEIW